MKKTHNTINVIKTTYTLYEYGYARGFLDGKTAAAFILAGNPVDHGDLLSANDPYAVGYRAGLNSELK